MCDTGEGGNAASDAPNAKRARAVTDQLPPGLTLGEAEAWRAGWVAARDRAAFLAFERGAWASNELDSDSAIDRFHAEPRMEMSREIRDAIKAMEPPK